MNRAEFAWLLALACLLVFAGLVPLLSFGVFGSDTGEYYRLTLTLVTTGHFEPQSLYQGWGTGYPDFPGLFALVGATSGALGVAPLSALLYVVPALAALSVLPLFLLFRRLFGHDLIALLGAGFAGFAMPRLFIIAHPAPQAVGDLLVVAGLWMYIEGRRDRRWYLPLALVSGALIVTHHLSSYFFLLAAGGALILFEVWRPGSWSRRYPSRELLFLGTFVAALLTYWFYYAPHFVQLTASGVQGVATLAPPLLTLGAVAAVLGGGLLMRWRRRSARSLGGRVRWPSDRATVIEIVGIAAAIVAGLALLLVLSLPPGNLRATPGELLFFAPYYVPLALTAGTRRLSSWSRLGPFASAWLGVLGISVVAALASPSLGSVLIPGRHVEFVALPLGLLLALGIGRGLARAGDRYGRRALVAGGCAVVLLLAANAAIAYPPQADFGGFEEGLTPADQALWLWAGIAVPPNSSIASDHRLSSMLFGFDGLAPTWYTTPALFTGSNWTAALQELFHSRTPVIVRPILSVAVDATMYAGVALDPAVLPLPLSAAAQLWFSGPPFVRLYENGAQAVYWVDLGGGK